VRIAAGEVNQPYSLGAQSECLASSIASQEDWELVAASPIRSLVPSSNVLVWPGRFVMPGAGGSIYSSSTGWTGSREASLVWRSA